MSSEPDHKTELGLVHLNVRTLEDVLRLAANLSGHVNKPDTGILFQEMARFRLEALVGCLRNSDFGSTITIGFVSVEPYRDVCHLVRSSHPRKGIAHCRSSL